MRKLLLMLIAASTFVVVFTPTDVSAQERLHLSDSDYHIEIEKKEERKTALYEQRKEKMYMAYLEAKAERLADEKQALQKKEAARIEEERVLAEAKKREAALKKEMAKEAQEAKETKKASSETVAEPSKSTQPKPKTPTGNGRYIGSFEATAYAVGAWGVPGTVTANGTDISNTIYSPEGYRIIAVDTSIIPMNSIVEVHVPGQAPFTAKASDTGGMIKGHIIDILMESPEAGLRFGRRHGIKLYIK